MENKKNCSLKTIFAVIGAIVSLAALGVVLYNVCKKYFQITFACDGDCDCCDGCDEECFEEDCEGYEPICCCQDEEEADEDDTDAE